MSKLGEFVLRQIKDNIETKKILDSEIFMDLITKMGIHDDWESLSEVISNLHENKIELNFKETDYDNYQYYKRAIKYVKFYKNMIPRKEIISEINHRIDLVKPKIDSTFLESYRNDTEE
jgi:hypothetical protein